MDNVSLQVPASLSEFSASSDGRTIAKLKMFYVGETADGRVFDKQFADKLVESLPYCPIVGFFSDIQDDFLGHNSKQYIYGIVKPDAEYGYETDNEGKDWLVTEVMLYTDRPDNTGDIAKKIVGKPHSLELNPNNVKYEVFSENGKRKIRFTEGSLIGLSVLGTNQKPAFTGSEFFMASDFSDMRERFDNFFSFLENNNGRGEQTMDNKTQFESYVNFVKLSYTEKMRKAESTLQEQVGDRFAVVIEDMDDNSFVAGKLDFESWTMSHFKYDYQVTDAEFTISNERAAFRKYLTVEELNYLESFGTQIPSKEEEEEEEKPEQASAAPVEEEEKEEQCSATTEEEEVEDKEEKEEEQEDMAAKEEETDEPQPEEKEEEEEVAKAQDINKEDDEEEEDEPSKEDEDDKEFSQHTSTLSDSERQELEVFRRQAKERLIGEYEGLLNKEILGDFTSKINEYDYNALEAALAIAFSKHTRSNKTIQKEIPLSFGTLQAGEQTAEQGYASLVKRILNK